MDLIQFIHVYIYWLFEELLFQASFTLEIYEILTVFKHVSLLPAFLLLAITLSSLETKGCSNFSLANHKFDRNWRNLILQEKWIGILYQQWSLDPWCNDNGILITKIFNAKCKSQNSQQN